jgi:hypothetical protein
MSYNFGITAFKTSKQQVVEFITSQVKNYNGDIGQKIKRSFDIDILQLKNGWTIISPAAAPLLSIDGAKYLKTESICYATYEQVGAQMICYCDENKKVQFSAIEMGGEFEFKKVDINELKTKFREDDSLRKIDGWEDEFDYYVIDSLVKYNIPFNIEYWYVDANREFIKHKNNEIDSKEFKFLESYTIIKDLNWGDLHIFGQRGPSYKLDDMLVLHS